MLNQWHGIIVVTGRRRDEWTESSALAHRDHHWFHNEHGGIVARSYAEASRAVRWDPATIGYTGVVDDELLGLFVNMAAHGIRFYVSSPVPFDDLVGHIRAQERLLGVPEGTEYVQVAHVDADAFEAQLTTGGDQR